MAAENEKGKPNLTKAESNSPASWNVSRTFGALRSGPPPTPTPPALQEVAPQPIDGGEVEMAVYRLQELAVMLEERIEELEHRIASALAGKGPTTCDDRDRSGGESELGDRLMGVCQKLEMRCAAIEELRGRVRL
ncbi:hypothetical protein LLG95_17185 [bacterium]|nr:hypothetical protein [bacterium]